MKVAVAGPASNIILAFIGGAFIRLSGFTDLLNNNFLISVLELFTWINIALAVFNMLPIAPLDGSQIFGNMISKNNPELALKLQIYGPKALMILILISFITPQFSIFRIIMNPFIKFFMYIFAGI